MEGIQLIEEKVKSFLQDTEHYQDEKINFKYKINIKDYLNQIDNILSNEYKTDVRKQRDVITVLENLNFKNTEIVDALSEKLNQIENSIAILNVKLHNVYIKKWDSKNSDILEGIEIMIGSLNEQINEQYQYRNNIIGDIPIFQDIYLETERTLQDITDVKITTTASAAFPK